MNNMMTFPDTWEEFEKSYGFTDNEEVYTNGARLIPSFRVKQWLDHLSSVQQEQLDCEDCIKHGGDWECDRVHCHKGDVPDTNVGELINRQDAIETALIFFVEYFGGAFREDDQLMLKKRMEELPSVQSNLQPTCNQLATDCISRQAAIDALWEIRQEEISDGRRFHDYCSLSTAVDVIKDLPAVQPQPEEDCDTCKHGYFGDRQCDSCRVRYPSHYEREEEQHGSD